MRDFWANCKGYPLQAYVVCLLAYTFSQMDLALFGYAVPAIREEFGVSLPTMGWVFSGSFTLGGVALVWLGLLSDRIGRKTMMQWSIGVSSVLIALHMVVPTLLLLTLLRGLSLASGGLLYPVSGAVVAEEAPARYRGLLVGLLQIGYPIGWLLASLLAAPLLDRYGWRPVFLIGIVSIPYMFVVHRMLRESARFTELKARQANRPQLRALFTPAMRRRTLILFLAQFLFVIAYGGSAYWFPTYFVETRGINIGTSAYLVGIGNGVGVLGYILAAIVGEFYLTRRTTVVIWTMLGAAAFLWLIWGTQGFAGTIAVFGIMSMFFYGTTAVKFAYVAELFPTEIRATGIALCSSLAVTLGIATGPLAVSLAVGAVGWNMAFSLFVAIPLVMAGLLYLLLQPVPSGLEVEDIQKHLRGYSEER